MTVLRTRQEFWDELIDSLALLDMARLHRLFVADSDSLLGELDVERALVQVQRTHGEVAGAYRAWVRREGGLGPKTVTRLITLLAQPPLIPLEVASCEH